MNFGISMIHFIYNSFNMGIRNLKEEFEIKLFMEKGGI